MAKIIGLYRYPVKSMQGEALQQVNVDERGFPGDRQYAVYDGAFFASAKHWKKWADLLTCSASLSEAGLRITLPDERSVKQAEAESALSELLGRPVELHDGAPADPRREADRADVDVLYQEEAIKQEPMAEASPGGRFFDHAPIHIVTTGLLNRLKDIYPDGDFAPERFRPNILLDEGTDGYHWIGQQLLIGDAAFNVIDPTPRCVITTLPQGDLPRDIGILKTIAKHTAARSATLAPGEMMRSVVGVYAQVVRGGSLQIGDLVTSM